MTTEIAIEDLKFLSEDGVNAMHEQHTFVPEHTRGSIIRFIEFGIEPGSFLLAVINNDLKNAFGQADIENTYHIRTIVSWFYNYAPSNCWGYNSSFEHWREFLKRTMERLK